MAQKTNYMSIESDEVPECNTDITEQQKQELSPIQIKNHRRSRDAGMHITLNESNNGHRTSLDNTIHSGCRVITKDGSKGVVRSINILQIELDGNGNDKKYIYRPASDVNILTNETDITMTKNSNFDDETKSMAEEQKDIETPISNHDDYEGLPSDWEGDDDNEECIQNDYGEAVDEAKYEVIDERMRNERDDMSIYQMMYIPERITKKAIEGKYIKEQFSNSNQFYHYLNNNNTLQKLDQFYKKYRSMDQDGKKLVIFNTELHTKQNGEEIYIVGSENDMQKSQTPWKMKRFMTATQIEKICHIKNKDLPKGCRRSSRIFTDFTKMPKNKMGNNQLCIKNSAELQQIWTQQQNRKKKGKKKTKKPGMMKKENVLNISVPELNECIQRAINSTDPEDDLKVIVSFEKTGKSKQINSYCIDHLLPVKINNNRIGIIWRSNKPNIMCSDWRDIQNKMLLYSASNDRIPAEWLENNITDLKFTDDPGNQYTNNMAGRPRKTGYAASPVYQRSRQNMQRYLQSAPNANGYNDNDRQFSSSSIGQTQLTQSPINNAVTIQPQLRIPSMSHSVSNAASYTNTTPSNDNSRSFLIGSVGQNQQTYTPINNVVSLQSVYNSLGSQSIPNISYSVSNIASFQQQQTQYNNNNMNNTMNNNLFSVPNIATNMSMNMNNSNLSLQSSPNVATVAATASSMQQSSLPAQSKLLYVRTLDVPGVAQGIYYYSPKVIYNGYTALYPSKQSQQPTFVNSQTLNMLIASDLGSTI